MLQLKLCILLRFSVLLKKFMSELMYNKILNINLRIKNINLKYVYKILQKSKHFYNFKKTSVNSNNLSNFLNLLILASCSVTHLI